MLGAVKRGSVVVIMFQALTRLSSRREHTAQIENQGRYYGFGTVGLGFA